MKKLLLAWLCCSALAASGQIVNLDVYVTNAAGTTNGNTFTLNSDTRTATNNINADLAKLFQATNSMMPAATNLWRQLSLYPFTGPMRPLWISSNAFRLSGINGQTIAFSIGGNWGFGTLWTNPAVRGKLVEHPIELAEPSTRTNVTSGTVAAINTYPTNRFNQNAPALGELVGTNNQQTVSSKRLTDVYGISGTNTLQRGGTYQDAVGVRLDLTNTWSLSGTNRLLVGGEYRDGVGVRLDLTNVVSLSGTNRLLREGRFENATFNNITNELMVIRDNSTDAIGFEYGGAIESKIMSSGSYPFPVLRDGSGVTVNLNGVTPDDFGVLLNFASAVSYFPILNAVGSDSTNHWNTVQIWGVPGSVFMYGFVSTNATNYDSILHRAALYTSVLSNTTFSANSSNHLGGDLSFGVASITTLANGTNRIDSTTNVVISLDGTLTADSYIAGIAGGRSEKWHKLPNRTSFNIALLHNSGLAASAADRFSCPRSRDAVIPAGGYAMVSWDATSSLWLVENVFPEAGPIVAAVSLTVDNQIVSTTNATYLRFTSNDGTAANRTVILTPGQFLEQQLRIEALSSSNSWQLQDDNTNYISGNVRLNGDFNASPPNDFIVLIWNGTDWVEDGRSLN